MNYTKKLSIGVDIDESICHLAQDILDILNNKNNTNHTLSDITRYEFGKCISVSDSDINYAVKKAIYSNPKPVEHASDVINLLGSYGDIFFLTKRKHDERDVTIKLLKDIGIKTQYALFTECDKPAVINRLSIDYMIEDRAKHAEDIAFGTNCTTLLLDRPWNRHAAIHSRILRVFDWKDIMIYFLGRL